MSAANKRKRKEERKLKKEVKKRIGQKCCGSNQGRYQLLLFGVSRLFSTHNLKGYVDCLVRELSGEKNLSLGWLKPLIRKKGFIQQEEILDNLEIIPIYVVTSDSE